MDVDELDAALADAFTAAVGERRAVARMACDLAATGRYGNATGHDLTPEVVVVNLQDAPDDGLASKWNWWLGALELSFGREVGSGGFAEFQVRQYGSGDAEDSEDTGAGAE